MSKPILGVGLGFFLTLGPLTCSKITPVVLRGLSTAGVNLGISVSHVLSNSVIKAYAGPFAIQLFFSLFLLVGLPFAPESPWYLLRTTQASQAEMAVKKLWGKDSDTITLLAAIQLSIEESAQQQSKVGYKDYFRGTNLLRSCISYRGFIC
ncbi:general substrate transporter [Aspergillus pseudoustus]|uniref:General substrate transporter n=1 Tax=Aspergillus pseudoustus TaxID=1810923 RepID=A0ABR4K6J9_9EURO